MQRKTYGLRAVKLTEIPRDQRLQAARLVAREGTHEPEDLITAALFPSDKIYFVRAQAAGDGCPPRRRRSHRCSPFEPDRFHPGMSLEELMPDEDRRDVALGGLAIVVEHADEIYPTHGDPGEVQGRPRWLDILQELSHGHDIDEAAERLNLASETIKSHTKRARRALNAKNTLHAVAEALRRGFIE